MVEEENISSDSRCAEGLENFHGDVLLLERIGILSSDLVAEIQVPAILCEAPNE